MLWGLSPGRCPRAVRYAPWPAAIGSDIGDAELFERSVELRGLAAPGQLFGHRPVLVVAHQDAVLVPVRAPGAARAAQQPSQQTEIAAGVLRCGMCRGTDSHKRKSPPLVAVPSELNVNVSLFMR